MKIIFINNKLFFLSVIFAFIAGCSDGSKSNGGPVVGIADLSPGIAVSSSIDLEEGDDGSQIAAVGFTASTDGIVNYTTYDIDAVAKSDYLPQSGQYEMQAGQSYEIGIEILSDTRVEADEKVGVLITDESGAELGRLVATILNDDFPSFIVTGSDVTEGNIGSSLIRFNVELAEETVAPFPITVVSTSNPSSELAQAQAGSDYTAYDQTLIFTAGEISKSIEIEVFGDYDIELDEQVTITASHQSFTHLPVSSLIRTDDFPGNGAPTFEVNAGRTVTLEENDTNEVFNVEFTIDETGGFTKDFTLNYFLREIDTSSTGINTDTAEIDKDFGSNLTQVSISADQTTYTAQITLLDDDDLETIEVLELVLANDAGVEFGSGRIYITDNESPEFRVYRKYTNEEGVEVESEELRFLEGTGSSTLSELHVELVSSAGYDYPFNVLLRTKEVADSSGLDDFVGGGDNGDIISNDGFIVRTGDKLPTSNNGESELITFTLDADSTVEANEIFYIELQNSNGSLIGDAIPITIINDDMPGIRWADKRTGANVVEFKINEEDDNDEGSELELYLELFDKDIPQDAITALENFDIVVERVLQTGSVDSLCKWRDQNDLAEAELQITTEGAQVYEKSAANHSILLTVINDNVVECDEIVDLKVSLKSQNVEVSEFTEESSQMFTVVNQEVALLSIYEFTESEAVVVGGNVTSNRVATFDFILDSNISLNASFSIERVGAEESDAEIIFNEGIIDTNTSPTAPVPVAFAQSAEGRIQKVFVEIEDDSIVEIPEAYALTLTLGDTSAPVRLQTCKIVNDETVCIKKEESDKSVTVTGIINSDDNLNIEITPKILGVESVNASELTAVKLGNASVSKPYQVSISNEIDADVPSIDLTVEDKCLLLTDDECAHSDDFSTGITNLHTYGSATTASLIDLSFELKIDDDLVEPDEIAKLIVSLANPSDYVAAWVNQEFNYSIANDDFLILTFANATDINIAENAENAEGNLTDTGQTVSWTPGIASNVPEISFNITEVCNDPSVVCVSNVVTESPIDVFTAEGDLLFSQKLIIHANGTETPASSKSLGVKIKNDTLVEENEQAIINVALNTPDITGLFLLPSWVDKSLQFQINNDDTFRPALALVISGASSINAQGNENESQSVELHLTWDAGVASDIPAFNFVITAECIADALNADCDNASNPDFNNNSIYSFSDKAGLGSESLSLNIIGNEIVEPNEELTFRLSLASSDQAHLFPENYFSDPDNLPAVSYKVINDDKLTVTIANDPQFSGSVSEESVDAGYIISWDKEIAKNVPEISFELTETCDENNDLLCVETASPTGNDAIVVGDISFTKKVTLHGAGQVANTPSNKNGDSLGINVVEDPIVEPHEDANVSIALNNADDMGLKLNENYLVSAWTESNIAFQVLNDDVIKPTFFFKNAAAIDGLGPASGTFNESTAHDVSLTLGWNSPIASNVTDLNLVITPSCIPSYVGDAPSQTLSCDSGTHADYVVAAGYALSNKADEGTQDLTFSITDNKVVEPDETVTLSLGAGTSPEHYFPDAIDFPTVSYKIINDDKLSVVITEGEALVVEGLGVDGNENDTGYKLSWGTDKAIAKNIPTISFSLTETCDESHVVNGTTDQQYLCVDTGAKDDGSSGVEGDITFDNTVALHTYGTQTNAALSEKSLGVKVHEDSNLEPSENAEITLILNSETLISPYFVDGWKSASWIDASVYNFQVTNNDTFIPSLVFENITPVTDSSNKTTGSLTETIASETGKDGNGIGVVFGWGSPISDQIKDINFKVTTICSTGHEFTVGDSAIKSTACSAGDINLDYVSKVPSKISLTSEAAAGTLAYKFSINPDSIFEPGETVTIALGYGTTPPHYFPENFVLPSIEFEIINDDSLGLSLALIEDHQVTEGSEVEGVKTTTDAGYKVTWNKEIAFNVPTIEFNLADNCNEDSGETNARLCIITEANTDGVTGDVSFLNSVRIHTEGDGDGLSTAANTTGQTLGINAVGDNLIEPHEVAKVVVSLANLTHLNTLLDDDNQWSKLVLEFDILNDDTFQPTLVFNDNIGSTGAQNGSVFSASVQELDSDTVIDLTLGWSGNFATNIDNLAFTFSPVCLPIYPLTNTYTPPVRPNGDKLCDSSADYNTSKTDSAYTITAARASDKTKPISQEIDFKLIGDSIVEPKETLTFQLQVDSKLNHYFTSSTDLPSAELTILNDDKLEISLTASSKDPYQESGTTGHKVSWKQAVSENVPPIVFSLTETCSEASCVETSVGLVGEVPNQESRILGDIEAPTEFILHNGLVNTSTNASGTNLNIEIHEDDVVEPTEGVLVLLTMKDETSSGINSTNYLSAVWSSSATNNPVDFEIANDDYLTITTTVSPSVDEGTVDPDVSGSGITNTDISITWDKEIASNVPAINVELSILCETGTSCIDSTMTEDLEHKDFVFPLTGYANKANLVEQEISEGVFERKLVFPVSIVADDYVEPTEIINVISIPSVASGLISDVLKAANYEVEGDGSYRTTPNKQIVIASEDAVALTIVDTADQSELDGSVKVAWEAYRVESYTALEFDAASVFSNYSNVIAAKATDIEAVKIDDDNECIANGNYACKYKILNKTLSANTPGIAIIKYVADDIIELDEKFDVTLTKKTGTDSIPVTASTTGKPFTILNDDYLEFGLRQGVGPATSSTKYSNSIMLNESSVSNTDSTSLKLIACNKSGVDMSGGSFTLGASIARPDISNLKTSDRIAFATVDDDYTANTTLSFDVPSLNNGACQDVVIITDFKTNDETVEPHEWLAVNITSDERCNGGKCFGSGTLVENQGLVVIANDDFDVFSDTGVNQCLSDAAIPSLQATGNCGTEKQDVDINRSDLSFVKLTSAGLPVLNGAAYSCISDGSTGYVWTRYGLDADDNNVAGIDDEYNEPAVGWTWGAGTYNATNIETDVSGVKRATKIQFCGKADWRLPTVNDLLNIADYQYPNVINAPLFLQTKYWTNQECTTSTDDAGHWSFTFDSTFSYGASECVDNDTALPIRAVSGG